MVRMTSRLMASFSLLAGLALSTPAQIATDLPARDWSLSPGTAQAGASFELTALSYRYTCATTFSDQSVVVNESHINLAFHSATDPRVLCPAVYKPFGPTFKMPALKPGQYRVTMNLWLDCHPECRAAIPQEEAGTLIVAEEGRITYVIDPTQVNADQAFVLNLLSPQFGCNIEYSRLASRVQDNKINLTFLDKANPLVRCIPEKKMYGPAYRMPALKAGVYEVWAERLPACIEEGCKKAPETQLVAKLVVKAEEPQRKGWFLKPGEVKAGTNFTLKVVNNEYGNCNYEFSNTSVVVQDGRISVAFSIAHHPERVCITDIRPHGPSFQLQALKAGTYPVFVNALPACAFEKPVCTIAPSPRPQVAADTLSVIQTLSTGGTSARPGAGPLAAWRDGALSLRLPAGAKGLWHADVLSLDGQRLHSGAVPAEGGAALLGFRKPERGMVLVRLRGPESKETHTLRVPVAD